jgi:hypothetical protein
VTNRWVVIVRWHRAIPLRPESRVSGRTHGNLEPAPRWLVAVAVILAKVMIILDMTIVNVALPHLMGALGRGLTR